jgi:hypothetical protein
MRGKNVVVGSLLIVGVMWVLASCASVEESAETGWVVLEEEAPAEAVERARDTADAFGGELITTLFRELEDGNPINAIHVCSEQAQEMSARFSTEGMRIRRVSRRFRNPADEPDDYELARLGQLQALHDKQELPSESIQVVREGGTKSLRYMKPIVIKQPCMMCHGQVGEIDDAVLDSIHTKYPGDQAIGYKVGDLRGAFTVVVDL